MRKIKDSKWVYIALSVLIAVVLWLYVRQVVNPEKTWIFNDIHISFVGLDALDQRGLMLSEGADQTVTLSLYGKIEDLKKLDASNVAISVNIAGVSEPGTLSINTQSCKVNFPNTVNANNIQIRSQQPDNINLTISKRASREVALRGVFNGSVADGFQKGEFNITPATVVIKGTEEQVNKVNYAQIVLSEEKLSATFTGTIPFTLVGYDGQPVEMTGISSDIDAVQVTLPVVKLKEVKLTVALLAGGGATAENANLSIEPSTIMVSGSEAALEGLEEISLGSIDLSTVYDGASLTFSIHPDGELTNVSGITEANVTVRFTGLETKTIEANNITFINVPDGYQVRAVTQSRQIQIRGEKRAVEAIDPSQIRIQADLSLIPAAIGNQTVPVKVYLDGSSSVGVVGADYNIVVSITK